MNYQETLEYLYTKLPLFSRLGSAAYKKDLTNIQALSEHLGHPHHKFRSIHVAGTNGKGSVSHTLAAVLQTAGYKTGLYTSPHLKDFRERIRVDGSMVPEEWIVRFVQQIQPQIEILEPSFFEVTVAMAFSFFAEQQVDVAVIEVGMGGRLDSTNIIHPELSIITNIGWDHQNILGNTLEAIAFEKAGIIKAQVPVVIGERQKETAPVFEKIAAEKNAPLVYAEDEFTVKEYQLSPTLLHLQVWDVGLHKSCSYSLDLPGLYQLKNFCTVLTAVKVLSEHGWNITENHICTAAATVKKLTGLQGRWEIVRQKPDVILEVAHNEDGMRNMVQQLKRLSYNQLHLVFGMVKDKEVDAVLRLLPREANYYFTQAQIPRALDAETLRQKAAQQQLTGLTYHNVNEALEAALQKAAPEDIVVVCGSVFLVGEVEKESFKGVVS